MNVIGCDEFASVESTSMKFVLVDKPAVKKVVKGLKKASKSHAKQADQLEKAMKKKSK